MRFLGSRSRRLQTAAACHKYIRYGISHLQCEGEGGREEGRVRERAHKKESGLERQTERKRESHGHAVSRLLPHNMHIFGMGCHVRTYNEISRITVLESRACCFFDHSQYIHLMCVGMRVCECVRVRGCCLFQSLPVYPLVHTLDMCVCVCVVCMIHMYKYYIEFATSYTHNNSYNTISTNIT